MSDTIRVQAGWVNPEENIGLLFIEKHRGTETISFAYNSRWLQQHPGFFLDPDIHPYSGRQFLPDGKDTFGFLADISPDRWGRRLADRREIIKARQEERQIRKLSTADYMCEVYDLGRTGAIRLQDPATETYISSDAALAIPPLTHIRRLEDAARGYEEETNPYEEKWLKDLYAPGSSLGGARPKANIRDSAGDIWIAKFPSRNDDVINVGAWEKVAHDLMQSCGIEVPLARTLNLSDRGSTFLVKRFDREISRGEVLRIPFMSAMTITGRTDHSEQTASYQNIADAIAEHSADPDEDLKRLWIRMCFNILTSNTDDHLRNHGFIYKNGGWRLSPAYDVNPVYNGQYMGLCISENDNTKDIRLAADSAWYYGIEQKDAEQYIQSMQRNILDRWHIYAAQQNIPRGQQELMGQAFSECRRDLHQQKYVQATRNEWPEL